MTVKTTLSFTDRHHAYLQQRVDAGVYATTSAAISAAVEGMMQNDLEFQAHVNGLADIVRERMKTPVEEYLDADDVFAELMADLESRKTA